MLRRPRGVVHENQCSAVVRSFHPGISATAALGSQGKHGEADALHLRAIGIQEKALGPDHPDLAKSLGNRANVLKAQVLRLSPGEDSVFVP